MSSAPPCVRVLVPTLNRWIETEKPIGEEEARLAIAGEGVQVLDDKANK